MSIPGFDRLTLILACLNGRMMHFNHQELSSALMQHLSATLADLPSWHVLACADCRSLSMLKHSVYNILPFLIHQSPHRY